MLNKLKNLFTIQRTSLAVSVFGISFQLFILNPWNKQISNQLNLLDNKIIRLENINTNKLDKEKDINKNRI